MPKTTAPLLSFDARGQIAKTQVYSSWRGISYVRRYAIPNNPNSTRQVDVRDVFRFLNAVWVRMPAIAAEPWNAYAVGKPLIGRNALIKFNARNLSYPTVAANLDDLLLSPGSGGGLPPISITPTPGDGEISVAVTVPDPLPTGWTITAAQGAALKNVAPDTAFDGEIVAAQDTTSTYTVVFTGLTNGQEYQYGIWLKWQKPDGTTAYSVSLLDQATPSS